MRVEDLDYNLPRDRIAQRPSERREDARLLIADRTGGALRHARIPDLPNELVAGDLVVANNTRVLPARLRGNRVTGGRVELLLIEPTSRGDGSWHAMAQAGGRLSIGETLSFGDARITLVDRPSPDGLWVVRATDRSLADVCTQSGLMPLPPYIERDDDDPRAAQDRTRYQTVYAAEPGAVAAPTAGLHLTDDVIAALRARGVDWATLTLHVGLGTFQPVRTDDLNDHTMHAERYTIPEETAAAIRATKTQGGRIVAIGTTTVRALEASAQAAPDGRPTPGPTRTDLLIQPGFSFRVVDALLTNFHLPRSTLLALVAAFMGLESMHAAYRAAIEANYRFYSYGDAMLIRDPRSMPA